MRLVAFIKEVKAEALKIVWPSRKETMFASILVILVTVLVGLFFLLVDSLVHKLIRLILGI
ncbi:preprotein translocase subunit SecE [Rickettsiales endosymbiont of Peranema trichophorum]|uniref:preprotein translocase subunit SecE n=1 Tax=Rickettsiales endosymbiont of Peranema trichophorum TaxID=2486577 RepID=UPI0010233C1C|nr:preprotein translocase subunit SecE [Rickettsiales endosymbiont of Peranema trichophorum]